MNEISNNEAMATIDMNALYERCDATIARLWDKFFGFERSDNPNDWVKNPENYDVDLKLFIAGLLHQLERDSKERKGCGKVPAFVEPPMLGVNEGYVGIKITVDRHHRNYPYYRVVGRYVYADSYRDGMHIHHVNGDKMDNRLENLTPLDPREHNKIHRQKRAKEEKSKRKAAASLSSPDSVRPVIEINITLNIFPLCPAS